MKITLDFKHAHTPEAVQEYLARSLGFPAYYGKNLDALHDMLTSWDSAVTFVLRFPAPSAPSVREYFPRLQRVFRDAAAENPRLRVQIR